MLGMLDWLTKGALPIGMLMFLGTLFAVLRRKTGRHLAQHKLPLVGKELGLSFHPSAYRGAIGLLDGTYRGFHVVVDPDEQRSIIVRFHSAPRIDFRTYEHYSGAPYGLRTYRSGQRGFDGMFKTRFVSEEAAALLDAVADLSALVEPLKGRYWRQIRSLSITPSGVTCVLDFGSPPYIPADCVRNLLPELVALARVFEPEQKASEAAELSAAG
jgi:hypothetical protein